MYDVNKLGESIHKDCNGVVSPTCLRERGHKIHGDRVPTLEWSWVCPRDWRRKRDGVLCGVAIGPEGLVRRLVLCSGLSMMKGGLCVVHALPLYCCVMCTCCDGGPFLLKVLRSW